MINVVCRLLLPVTRQLSCCCRSCNCCSEYRRIAAGDLFSLAALFFPQSCGDY